MPDEPDLRFRFARPEDRDQVFEISSTVWEGNDYIPEVWEGWLAETPSEGFLLAVELGGRIVGIQHTALQPGKVAWMEGIRVHPDYRNRGIANRLLQRGLDIALEGGSTQARLSTADANEASQIVAKRNGFGEVARFHRFSAPALSRPAAGPTKAPVTISQLDRVRALSEDQSSLLADGWTAYAVPGQKFPADFPLSYTAGDPVKAAALATPTPHRGRISIAYIGGASQAVTEIGIAIRHQAHVLGVESAGGMLRRNPSMERGVADAGYELRDDLSMIVFERSLAEE